MPSAGSYADVLRALGRYLDERGAENVEITEHESFLAVSWSDTTGEAGQRAYSEIELARLREEAQRMRGGGGEGETVGDLSELMRTMGQDLDEMGFESNRIAVEADSLAVTGIANRHYHALRFMKDELRASSDERRAQRRAPGARPPEERVVPEDKRAAPRWQFWKR